MKHLRVAVTSQEPRLSAVARRLSAMPLMGLETARIHFVLRVSRTRLMLELS